MELGKGEPLSRAALRSGMSENTARCHRGGELPSQRRVLRRYRTRLDPFASVWGEVEAMLEQAPGLEAVTIFEALRGRPEVSFSDGQVRTLQRRIRRWRALQGPEREVMFAQEHRAGEYAQSDFTCMNELGVSLAGERFEHLFFHFVLPYSNWETGGICFSESFEALIAGLQSAVWELGKVPRFHRTDNLSAATHELGGRARGFNERYLGVLGHYGLLPDANTPGRGHENGDVEQAHHRFKRSVSQALLLRGSAEFAGRGEYESFLRQVLSGRNRGRQAKLREELAQMHELPRWRLDDFRVQRAKVSAFSTLRVADNVYSVASRLIGEWVDLRLYAERIEVFYAGERVAQLERLRGRGHAAIDYHHLVWSLIRKPGAFARYRYREALFPSLAFRRAYDALEARHGGRADGEYVRILHLAAGSGESAVEAVLSSLLEAGELSGFAQVQTAIRPPCRELPDCHLEPPDLASYDECIAAGGAR
ncbi:MAG TPA: IS21 family transposase [Thermoanaerobaculia bacterium]|nr:IS21 family transposase [Thermoanaerobaculia bacterium]